MPKKRKIVAIAALSLVSLTAIDMIIGRSWYHPLVHVYKLASWKICRSEGATCEYKQALSAGGQAAVSTSQQEATEVGIDVLRKGGNAVDAAVAVGYALAVVHPCCGNLGGGGFMTLRLADGTTTFIDFRETAPLAATPTMYLDEEGEVVEGLSTDGYLAAGVPGTVAGLDYARNKYGSGKLTEQELIAPAIILAEDGFILGEQDQRLISSKAEKFRQNSEVADIFLNQKEPPAVGDRFIQKDLSTTLKLISEEGSGAFYSGAITDKVVAASQKNGGIFTLEDFAAYRVQETDPLACNYRGYTVVTSPPPGGGTVLCQMLNIVQGYPIGQAEYHSAKHLHWVLSAMLFAYQDRNLYFGDPNFVDVPVDRILSDDYAEELRSQIPLDKATKLSKASPQPEEGENTTHFSIVDKAGNAVSLTYTINTLFGSGVIAEGTGFFLNNEMDDFTAKPGVANSYGLVQSAANKIEPGKRPLSSMAPTIVLDADQNIDLVTGSPGGSTIPTTVFQAISNLVDFEMSPTDAVNQPRIHYQGSPNIVATEPFALTGHSFNDLWDYGYRVMPLGNWGAAMSVGRSSADRQPVKDIRRPQGDAKAIAE